MGLVPYMPPTTKAEHKLFLDTCKIRGVICEFCGENAAPVPGKGKLRIRHCCTHGLPCERGKSEGARGGRRWQGNGTHANWPTCPDCIKTYKAKLKTA
jgi:hypothetical protein